jgi:hypothetical protein
MGLFTWIKGLGHRGSNPPAPGNKPPAPPEPPLTAQLIRYWAWEREQVRVALPESTDPPTKPQPTGGRLIYVDRDPGPAETPSDTIKSTHRNRTMAGPFDFPRPLRPPGLRNPYLNAMSAASLIAGFAFIFDANVIAFVFGILTCICFALTILHTRFQP